MSKRIAGCCANGTKYSTIIMSFVQIASFFVRFVMKGFDRQPEHRQIR